MSVDCYIHLNITEIDDPLADVDVTLRWEREPFIKQKAQEFGQKVPYHEDKMGKHDDDGEGISHLLGWWQHAGGDKDFPNDENYICNRIHTLKSY